MSSFAEDLRELPLQKSAGIGAQSHGGRFDGSQEPAIRSNWLGEGGLKFTERERKERKTGILYVDWSERF